MVYFRERGLYLPCPIVQREKGPVFTIFFWVDISNNYEPQLICLLLGIFGIYKLHAFDFSK